MPTTGVYLLLATLAAPPMVKLGIEPIAAHMFVLYFGMLSMITPPIAIAAFTAANLSGDAPMRTAMAAVRFGWPAYVVPFLFVLSPTLLMQGDTLHISLAVITAIGGVFAATAGIAGFLARRLTAPVRVGLFAGGIALLIPPAAFPAAWYINVIGAAVCIALAAYALVNGRRNETVARQRSG